MIKRKSLKVIFSNLFVLISLIILIDVFLHIVPPFDRLVTFRDANVKWRESGPNKEYIWKGPKVGSISQFKTHVRTNSLGFHDRDYDFHKKEGVYRILILGDSLVEASQVPLDKTFHKKLEEMLREVGMNVEVIALGHANYGPMEAVELYLKFGRLYDPDLVIWCYTQVNDITDSYPKLKKLVEKRRRRYVIPVPNALKFSKIVSFLLHYLLNTPWFYHGDENRLPFGQ